MKITNWRIIIGGLLLLMGAVALLQNFNVIPFGAGSLWGIFWALIFIAGGVAFLSVLISNRENWWAAIPGITLVGLGTIIIISTLFPGLGEITGAIFLASIGVAFWIVYFLVPQNWWAIIPGGTLLTLAAVTIVSPYNGEVSGGLFFIGLGVTFALLALIPSIKMKWAWIPATVLGIMGIMIAFASIAWNYLWPAALIVLGAYFIFRAFKNHW
jgi:hypothetical protein